MPNPTDNELLSQFADSRCDRAFREVVARHIDLVHSVAGRITNNPIDAKDIAQEVFSKLAHEEGRIPNGVPLAAWLHRTTRSTAANHVRSEVRRRKRQEAAASLEAMKEESTWQELEPLIDGLIDELPRLDRRAIVLRFYSSQSYAEIGEQLAISEEAARKRVTRGLEKLRGLLGRRGITATTALLGTVLPAHAVVPAPATLAPIVSASALASSGATVAASTTLTTILAMTTTTKICLGAAAALILTGVVTIVATNAAPQNESNNSSSSHAEERGGVGDAQSGQALSTRGDRSGGPRKPPKQTTPTGPPAGIDAGTWAQAETLFGMLMFMPASELLPDELTPGKKVLQSLQQEAGLSDKSMASITEVADKYRKDQAALAGKLFDLVKKEKAVMKELLAIEIQGENGGPTEEHRARNKELVKELESSFKNGEEWEEDEEGEDQWFKNEVLLTGMKAELTPQETGAFQKFVEERQRIANEGWAFNRSQKLANDLHLKPEQRQAVFEELMSDGTEDSSAVAALLEDGQRSTYLEKASQKDEEKGSIFGMFGSEDD